VIHVSGRREPECATALAQAIVLMAHEPTRLALARGACGRYQDFSWRKVVAGLYAEIDARLALTAPGATGQRRVSRAGPIADAQPVGTGGAP
jgi:hypothetical protein